MAGVFVTEFSVSGMAGGAVALFFAPMSASLGWSLTQFTGAVTARAVAEMFFAPFLGPALDRYGARPIMLVGALGLGVSLLVLARVQEVWQFWALFAVGGALGMGGLGSLATPVVLAQWFVRNRARAIAVATSGQLLGIVVMAPAIGLLIPAVGWRWTWGALGIAFLALSVPAIGLLVRRRPEDMGLVPDGDAAWAASPGTTPAAGARSAEPEEAWTLREAIRTRTFWVLVASFNLIMFATISVSFHQVPYFTGQGMSGQMAGFMLMLSLGFGTLSRFLWAFLVGRFSIRSSLSVMSLFRTIGTIALVVVPYPFNIAPFLVFWGLLGGAVGLLLPLSFANYYGRAFQGSIQGALRPLLNMSLVAGPISLAVLFDATGSYDVPFSLAAALAALSVAGFAVAKPPRRRRAV